MEDVRSRNKHLRNVSPPDSLHSISNSEEEGQTMAKGVPLPVATQPAPLLVEDAVERFLERDWSPHTRRNFTSDLKRLRAAFAGRAVTDLP